MGAKIKIDYIAIKNKVWPGFSFRIAWVNDMLYCFVEQVEKLMQDARVVRTKQYKTY